MKKIISVTGAFSNTGKYLVESLANTYGEHNLIINNFTNNPNRPHDLNKKFPNLIIKNFPLVFDREKLKKNLDGSEGLYNSYWTRFNDYKIKRSEVIDNHKILIQSAKEVGVKKLVYVSHTMKEDGSSNQIPYIKSKHIVENICKEYFDNLLILRPCLIYADNMTDSIVINNLAYLMRTFKILPIVGTGNYPIHPVHARDLADEACNYFLNNNGFLVKDAISDKLTYIELCNLIKKSLGLKTLIIKNVPIKLVKYTLTPINYILKDKFLELDDLDILTGGHAFGINNVIGKRNLSQWINDNNKKLGVNYVNSLNLHYSQYKDN